MMKSVEFKACMFGIVVSATLLRSYVAGANAVADQRCVGGATCTKGCTGWWQWEEVPDPYHQGEYIGMYRSYSAKVVAAQGPGLQMCNTQNGAGYTCILRDTPTWCGTRYSYPNSLTCSGTADMSRETRQECSGDYPSLK